MDRVVEPEVGVGSEHVSTCRTTACEGCNQHAFVLRIVDGTKLCDGCVEKSALIDRKLETVRSCDPVDCDGCGDRVTFDARIAVVVRECGGAVLCDSCKPVAMERQSS
jgi:hypothetical protein